MYSLVGTYNIHVQNNERVVKLGGLGLRLVFFERLSRYTDKDGVLPSNESMGFACRGAHTTYSTCIHSDTRLIHAYNR